MGDGVKGFADVQADSIHGLPHIQQAGHLIIKGDQIDQEGPALPKITLAVHSYLCLCSLYLHKAYKVLNSNLLNLSDHLCSIRLILIHPVHQNV